jgi:hypothetical protein
MAYATAEENYNVEFNELELSGGEVMEHEQTSLLFWSIHIFQPLPNE